MPLAREWAFRLLSMDLSGDHSGHRVAVWLSSRYIFGDHSGHKVAIWLSSRNIYGDHSYLLDGGSLHLGE
jgi:hypothetical protein